MKKFSIVAALAIAVASFVASCGNSGSNKPNLKNDVDTLSYAIGLAQTQGLKQYLVQMDVDTTYMDAFIKGLREGANAGDDKKKAAYYMGIQIGQQISNQMMKGINQELFAGDSTKTISKDNFMAGFIAGTLEKGGVMTMEAAQEYTRTAMETIKAKALEEKYADYAFICGIDEVGRGPLAGPVVAGAVILPKECEILYINDSKKLSAAKRDELYDEIMDKAVAVGLGMASPARIDEINILQATYEAMRQAIGNLKVEPDLLLNDAVTIPEVVIPQVPIIKGDAKSVSIAAASIVAKVTRDRLMEEYDKVLPGYGFASNKGYGSAEHIKALQTLGPTPIHRRSFIGHFV